jgi:23S rRNA G2445 N2-methylase RlmL
VTFRGAWGDAWRANWWLRTANRVLVELASWPGPDGDALAAGAEALVAEGDRRWDGVAASELFHPRRSFALHATSSASQVRDTRWVALRVKDGLVDGQRRRWRRRSSVDRHAPDLPLRVWLHRDRAALLLDTSGEPLDRRGYRLDGGEAPLRETLAAGCVLASGWDGRGSVVDPMCGAGTLLAEAGWIALGRPPGWRRHGWAFERFPGFDRAAFGRIRGEPAPARPSPAVEPPTDSSGEPGLELYGVDVSAPALEAARANLQRAGLAEHAVLLEQDGFDFVPPPVGGADRRPPGLVVVNPPYGERLGGEPELWRRLGDLLKRRYPGWRAAVLAGDAGRGKWIGLKPSRRLPVRNGPLEARLLIFELY